MLSDIEVRFPRSHEMFISRRVTLECSLHNLSSGSVQWGVNHTSTSLLIPSALGAPLPKEAHAFPPHCAVVYERSTRLEATLQQLTFLFHCRPEPPCSLIRGSDLPALSRKLKEKMFYVKQWSKMRGDTGSEHCAPSQSSRKRLAKCSCPSSKKCSILCRPPGPLLQPQPGHIHFTCNCRKQVSLLSRTFNHRTCR